MIPAKWKILLLLLCTGLLLPSLVLAEGIIESQRFKGENEILITFSSKVDAAVVKKMENYTVFEEPDPDIRLKLSTITLSDDGKSALLAFEQPLNQAIAHVVSIKGLDGKTVFTVSKSYLGYLFGILLSALLINNFVFTKYLGLCVFFGTSKKKSTAKGMGVVRARIADGTGS